MQIARSFELKEFLSSEEKEFFAKHGYIHYRGFLSPSRVKEVDMAIDQVERHWIENNIIQINGIPIKFGKGTHGQKIVHRFAFTSLFNPVLHELIEDPRLQQLMPLLCENARLGEREKDGMVVNHYYNHPGSRFRQIGWHTDSIRDIFYGTRIQPMLNIGIHLNSFPMKNGGLRILPGTHKQNIVRLLTRKFYYLNRKADPKEVGFNVTAGDLTIHHGRCWHRVAKCSLEGEVSRRRVILLPIINGKYAPKDEFSKTPFYHRFLRFIS
ncbi:phytanoyl-CoA dioxygenase family protein [Xanthovirga aplysinae]|uniref:phytanoyl-CoA dioxygenase family protein n=1 Tax=Xanthovirga aplysinae TaxID=2529853 RepID=UPI0012BC6FA8|nr:phytanoyl-CoA dioxygenase family protein [Xanthovirga aplysinae]MTI32429.1 phytanoyl-CoA dioxygenase [Xanthovirga aplysinae]